MASFVIQPPDAFTFSSLNEWPKWKKRFERFRTSSGLCLKPEQHQVDALHYIIGFLGTVKTTDAGNWEATVLVKGQPVDFKIDTGADETVLPTQVFKTLKDRPLLSAPPRQLYGPDGKLPATGVAQLDPIYHNRATTKDVYVLDQICTPMLGKPAIKKLQMLTFVFDWELFFNTLLPNAQGFSFTAHTNITVRDYAILNNVMSYVHNSEQHLVLNYIVLLAWYLITPLLPEEYLQRMQYLPNDHYVFIAGDKFLPSCVKLAEKFCPAGMTAALL
ncbi:hypothetical protein MTO96_011459 [Rhipicephalus appendiculatus]